MACRCMMDGTGAGQWDPRNEDRSGTADHRQLVHLQRRQGAGMTFLTFVGEAGGQDDISYRGWWWGCDMMDGNNIYVWVRVGVIPAAFHVMMGTRMQWGSQVVGMCTIMGVCHQKSVNLYALVPPILWFISFYTYTFHLYLSKVSYATLIYQCKGGYCFWGVLNNINVIQKY